MSLVSTWVKLADGKWYQNPVLYSDSDNWYLCFDDDEPPELVIQESKQLSKAEKVKKVVTVLQWTGIQAKIMGPASLGQRLFPPDYKHFKQAFSYFIRIKKAFTQQVGGLSLKYDSVSDKKPEGQGVYYEW